VCAAVYSAVCAQLCKVCISTVLQVGLHVTHWHVARGWSNSTQAQGLKAKSTTSGLGSQHLIVTVNQRS
jgi:hypothetical protein